jgi:uncharacterized protein (DUF433 family)
MSATTARIIKTPGVCGGNACIVGTRIPVWGLVGWRRAGKSDDWLLANFPALSGSDLDAAWLYAAAHPDEIEEALRLNAEE